MLDEWNVKFAERIASKERRHLSRAMNCSYAMPAWLGWEPRNWNTAKNSNGTVLKAIQEKPASSEAAD
jgi:hypothetical protein